MEKNQSRTPVARQLDRAITCPITAAAKVSGEQDCLRDHDPDDYSRDARRTKLEGCPGASFHQAQAQELAALRRTAGLARRWATTSRFITRNGDQFAGLEARPKKVAGSRHLAAPCLRNRASRNSPRLRRTGAGSLLWMRARGRERMSHNIACGWLRGSEEGGLWPVLLTGETSVGIKKGGAAAPPLFGVTNLLTAGPDF
jgi:hypothetical protein